MKAWDYDGKEIDITGANLVEILIREDGHVVWVNVDGKCLLRVCRIVNVKLNDMRKKEVNV